MFCATEERRSRGFTLTVTRTVDPGGGLNLEQLLTSAPLTSQPASDTVCARPAEWSKNRTLFVLWRFKNQEAQSS